MFTPQFLKFKAYLPYAFLLSFLFISKSYAGTETFKKGSIIINMGATTPTVGNSLKPYGLVYDLLKNYNTPVSCIINPTKVKDGIDFSHNGKSFRGGPFIIPEGYRTSAVNKAINAWKSQGVLIDSLVSDVTLEVAYTMTFAPKWVMDATNGRVAVAYLTAAGIPSSSYVFKGPSALNNCDDIYVMPHADPKWISHNNLYFWNKSQKGAIWAGCNAVSIMEGLFKDTVISGVSQRLQMNFLSTTGLINYAQHSKVVLPLTHVSPASPMSQYIGISDAAQSGGAENVYMPKLGSAWRSSVVFVSRAPNQYEVPSKSPGPAATNLYGRAFDDPTRGYVAYQGAHSFSPSSGSPSTAQIAAQRMFFNFSFFAIKDKLQGAITVNVTGVPKIMYSGTTYTGFTATTGGTNTVTTYKWTSNIPGTFSNPTGATTSFTPSVTTSTDAVISCLVGDACGRTTFDTEGEIVALPASAAFSANAITQSIEAGCGDVNISFNVFDSNYDPKASARTLTNLTSFSNGSATFTSSGQITYTPNANFTGTDVATYTISNGVFTANNTISITVGQVALAPVANTDAVTVLEDSVTTISVLANDKNNPSASNASKLYIRDILTKPSKGYVYRNSNGTLSYLSKKDASSGTGSDQFTYLVVNDLGYTSIGTVNITIVDDGCTSGQYKRGVDVAGTPQTLTFTPTIDNHIYNRSGYTTTNYGSNSTFVIQGRSSRIYKPLLKFDVSSIPSNITITSATLSLTYSASYTHSSTSGPFPIDIYNLKRDWTESGSTWTNYKASTAWGTAGAGSSSTDYSSTPTSQFTNSSNKVAGDVISATVTSQVQAWITTPANNFGLLLSPKTNTGSTTKTSTFHSRSATTTSNRPKLTVNYTTATVSFPCVTIPTNYKPIAYPDTFSVKSNSSKTVNVRSNDVNYYGNTNNLTSVTTPAHGTAVIQSGNVLYTPTAGYTGVDTFTYTITDATNSQTFTTTVRVTVGRVAPTIVADYTTTNSNTAKTISVGLNDTDPQGQISSPTITLNPKFGTAAVSGSSIVYTPTSGYVGYDTLIYSRSSIVSATCDVALSDTAIVVVRVLNQNPIANPDTINTTLCLSKKIDLLANDTDPEGTLLTAVIVSNPSNGTLRKESNGKYIYTPTPNYSGADQFTYKIKDGSADSLQSNTATVSINVFPIQSTNIAPIAKNDSDLTYINQDFAIDVFSNDSDPDNDSLGISITAPGLKAPTSGTISLLQNNQILYAPNLYFSGKDTFEYKLTDYHESCSGNTSLSAVAKVYVTVSAVPISISGTVWSDLDNSANGTFNNIQTNSEIGTNAFATLKVYLVDSNNIIIDQTSVDNDGNYTLVNVPRVQNKVKLRINHNSFNNGGTLSVNELPTTYSNTTPLFKQLNTGNVDISGQDFGVNQLPSAQDYTFAEQVNPGASMIIDSSKVNGIDGESGALTSIKYLTFPTNVSAFKIGSTTYTSGTWPGAGVTVALLTPIRITPNAGLVTPVISFKVIDNGGSQSLDTGRVYIPLYLPLTVGSITGGGSAICGSGIPAAFTSSANATNGRATIQYQWQVSTTSTSTGFSDIPSATSAAYTPATAITQTSYFRRKVYTTLDDPLYSNVITITVNPLPSAPTSPNGGAVITTSGSTTISASVTGGNTIDWYAASTGGSVLSGGTGTTSYTTPTITTTTTYFAQTRNTTTGCVSSTRTPVTATVNGTVNGGVVTASHSLCGTDIPDTLMSTTAASGGNGSFTYRWQSSPSSTFASGVVDLDDDAIAADGFATDLDYTPTDSITATTYYRRKATDGNSVVGYSNIITVTVNALPSNISTVVSAARTGTGSVTLSATPVAGSTIDWYDALTGGNLLLSGSNTFTTPSISVTTTYYAQSRNTTTGCYSTDRTPVTATINASLSAGIVSGTSSICGSGTPTAFTSSTAASNGTGTIYYQWQVSTTSSTSGFSDIPSATNATYAPGSISTTTYYRRGAYTEVDAIKYSNVITITVNPLPTISISPSSPAIIIGNSVTLTASGANTYTWNTSATTASITVSPSSTTTYTVSGVDANGCQSSAQVTVTVNPLPSVGGTASAVAANICAGSTATINLTGNTGTIVWQTSGNGTSWADTTVTTSSLTTNVLAAGYRFYRAKVTNATAAPAYSNSVGIFVDPASVGGTINGGGVSVCSGTNSTVLTLSGHTGAIVKWQWSTSSNFSSNVNDIAHTGVSYTVTNISTQTYYRAVVKSGQCASTNSSITSLSIDPVSVGGSISGGTSVCTGTNSTNLTLSGHTGTIVKWQSSTSSDFSTNLTDISNTTANYTASNLTTTTYYRAVVKSGNCSSTTSSSATVTVNPLPGAPTSPTNGARTLPGTVSISASTPTDITIDWYANPTGGSVLTNGTGTNTFTTPSISATTTYYAQARNTITGCVSATRTAVVATVNDALDAGVIASNQTICYGSTPNPLTSSSAASGGTGTLNYIWQISTTSSTTGFADISGAISATYTPGALTQTTYYRRSVSSNTDATAYSNVVTITVDPTTIGGSVTGGATVCAGSNSTTLTVSGHTGTVTKWQISTSSNFSSGVTDTAVTSTSITITNLTATRYYRAVLKSGVCAAQNSSSASIVVDPVSVGGSVGGGTSVCAGTNSTTLTLTGYTGSITKWQISTSSNFSSGVTDTAVTSASITIANLSATRYYRAVVKNGVCATANSSSATITVNPIPNAPTSGVGGSRTGTGTVNISASVSAGETIDWYANSTGGTVLTNGTGTTTFTTPSISTTTTYYAQARNTTTGCISTSRIPVVATINGAFSAGSIAADQTICSGSTPAGLTSTTAASGGTGAISYQWQSSTTSTSSGFSDISSATSATYNPGALTQTTYYRRNATTSNDGTINSNVVTITVNPTSAAGTLAISSGTSVVCAGTNSTTLSLSGKTGNVVKWQSSLNGSSWSDVTNTTTTLTATNINATTYYRAIVKSGVCPNDTTAALTITINPSLSNNTITSPTPDSLYINGNPTNIVGTTPTGGTSVYTYQWQSSTTSAIAGFTNISGANNKDFDPSTINTTTWYRRKAYSGNCDSSISNAVRVKVQVRYNPPVANDDVLTVAEDASATASNVSANDTDVEGDALTFTRLTNVKNGTLTFNANGTYAYTPNANFHGKDTLTYSVCDNSVLVGCDTGRLIITVTSVNDKPVAVDDAKTTNEDQQATGTVATNDSDIDNDALSFSVITTTTKGTLTLNANGNYTYTPNANYNGKDTLTYKVCDNGTPTLCDTAILVFTVTPVNDKPVAVDDAKTTNEDQQATGTVATNDSDLDGDALSFSVITTTTKGTLTLNANGNYTYTPNANYNGKDTLTYKVCDNGTPTLCDTAQLIITVSPVNDKPVAVDDAKTTNEDQQATGTVATNDSDLDGDALSFSVITTTTKGTLTLNANGGYTYTPNANYNGKDTLTYKVCDNGTPTLCDTAILVFTVSPVNDKPVAVDDAKTTNEDQQATGTVATNDSDLDGDALSFSVINTTTKGTLTLNANGSYTYTPNANYNGKDTLTYKVCDNGTPTLCDTAILVFTVSPVNDKPVAVDDAKTTNEDQQATGTVATNDSDLDGDALSFSVITTTTKGTLTLNANGGYTYTPNANYNGKDTLTYKVCDNGTPTLCDTAILVFTVSPVNDKPVAVDDAKTTNEDQVATGTVAPNDLDIENGTLSFSVITTTKKGNLTLNSNGNYTYTPNANYNGKDTLTYEVCDNGTPVLCDTATLIITVTPVNDNPVASTDTLRKTTPEDTPITICIAGTDIDRNRIDVSNVSGLTLGSSSSVAGTDSCFTYTPNPNVNGLDTVRVIITDGNGGFDTLQVIITITPVNDPPVASTDTLRKTTPEDTPITICIAGTDIDRNRIDVSNVSGLTLGSSSSVAGTDSCFTYTPSPNVNGLDTVRVIITDGQGGYDTLQVIVTISPVNDKPVAVDDAKTTNEDQQATGTVATNDSDIDNDALSFSVITTTTKGTLTLNANGNYTYTPNANYNGKDTLTYKVCDNGTPTLCDTAQLIITVSPVNDKPVAVDDTKTTNEDQQATGTVATNDSDIDGDALSFSVITTTTKGTLTLNANGNYTYTPNANYNGKDTLTYKVCDNGTPTLCDTAQLIITVSPVNDKPVANDDAKTTNEDQQATGTVATNDSDIDNDALSFSVITTTTKGTLTLNANGNYTYTPNANYNGKDTLTYKVCDNGTPTLCDTAILVFTVSPVNDKPIAVDDAKTTNEDQQATGTVATNDSDIDGDALSFSVITTTTKGTLTLNANGNYTYTPNANYNGKDTLTYKVCDNGTPVLCDTAQLIITVTPVNDAPVASTDTLRKTTPEDTPITICIAGTDVENNRIDVSNVSGLTLGTSSSVTGLDSCFTYTPNPNVNGLDTVRVIITDGNGGFDTLQVVITITPVNDPPIAVDDNVSMTNSRSSVGITVLSTDSDIDNAIDQTSVVVGVNVKHGTATVNPSTGVITYTPTIGYVGNDTLTYTMKDVGGLASNSAVVVITVPVNHIAATNDNYTSTPINGAKGGIVGNVLSNDSLNKVLIANANDVQITLLSVGGLTGASIASNGELSIPAGTFEGTYSLTYKICETANTNNCRVASITVAVGRGLQISTTSICRNDVPYLAYTITPNFTPSSANQVSISWLNGDGTPLNPPVVYNNLTQSGELLWPGAVLDNNGLPIDWPGWYTQNGQWIQGADGFEKTRPSSIIRVTINPTDSIVASYPPATPMCNSVPSNRAPVAVNDTKTTNEDQPATGTVATNDSDLENGTLSFSVITTTTKGTLTLNANGNYTYTPNANYNGKDTLTYKVCDNGTPVLCDTAQLIITVTPVNDAPVASTDTLRKTTPEDTPITICIAGTDVENNRIDVSNVSGLTLGTSSSVTGLDSCFTYTPNPNVNGLDTVRVIITDGNGGFDTVQVIITITPVNDAPVASTDTLRKTTPEDTPITICIAGTDIDHNRIDVSNVSGLTLGASSSVTGLDSCFTYTPNPNVNGLDTVRVIITDGNGGFDTLQVVITITPVNDKPVAVDDAKTTNEDQQATGTVATNDSDLDGDALSFSVITTTTKGTLTLNANGNYTYTPNANYNGKDTLTYKVCDNGTPTLCDTAQLIITVSPVNDKPVAVDDAKTTNEDQQATGTVATNDSDIDNDALSFSVITTTKGTLTLNANGSYTYTPNANYNGKDTLTYKVCDNGTPTLCDTAQLIITVSPVNDKPVAVDDAKTTNEDQQATGTVATNDSDIDGDALSFSVIATTTKGTLTLNANGNYTYTPNANYNGKDTLTYKVCDNGTPTLCDTAQLIITVSPVNDKPVAVDDTKTTNEDQQATGTVATNDSDIDGDALSFSVITTTTKGTLTLNANGNYTYTPNANYNGKDTLTYKVCDNGTPTLCDTAQLIITVSPVNDKPVAVDDAKTTNEDQQATGTVATNDSDIDGDALSFSVITSTTKGSLSLNADGSYTYTPNADFNGKDTLTYQVCDNGTPTLCDTAILVIEVNPINDQPIAIDDVNDTNEDVEVSGTVALNDSDIDRDLLGFTLIEGTKNGTIKFNSDGTYTYTPNLNFNGSDTLMYKVCDDGTPVLCDTAILVIVVNPINDKPVAIDDINTTQEELPVSGTVATNDSDVDGDVLSFSVIISTKKGNLTLNANGNYTYTPNANFNGKDTLTYKVCDNGTPTLCDTAILVITVNPINDAPVAIEDANTTLEELAVSGTVATNDTDIDGDALSFSVIQGTTNGSIVINANGDYTYTPNVNFNGKDTVTYKVCDNGTPSLCDTAILVITVTPVNDKPVAINDTTTTPINTTLVVNASVNDFDVDLDNLSYTFFTPQHGTINNLGAGQLEYIPNNNVIGLDSLMYIVCDNGIPSLCDTAYVFIDVIGNPNTPPVAVRDEFTIPENYTMNESVSTNDWDPENNTMVFDWAVKPLHGTFTMSATGLYTYTPDRDFVGVDSFMYVVCDNGTPSLCDTNICIINIINTPKPSIGVALRAEAPESVTNETYNITYTITLENHGDIDLDNVQVIENLASVFPEPAEFNVVEVIAGSELNVNANFDGVSDKKLLDETQSYLAVGESRTIKVKILVKPNLPIVTYVNTVTASAQMIYGDSTVTDNSVDGSDSDPNGDNIPNESSETVINLTLFVPTGFSPDGDGVNDGFVIKGIENYPNNSLTIFNRWGNKVYEQSPYDNSWSGGTKNAAGLVLNQGTLPNGTYFYVLDFGVPDVKPITGYIVIKK